MTSASSAEQLRRLHRLFDEAMELAPEQRADWLARLAADEPELAARLQRLIAAEEAEAGLDASHLHRQIDQTLRDLMPESLASGTTVGAYRVIEEIGAGGMGRVFRAQRDDPSLHHEVAIKVVRRDMMTPQALTRFQAERAVLASLQHPGICQFIDAGTLEDGSPYVVMELLRDAIPIAAFADRERLDIDQRIDLFRRVLDAVQYAHRNLIVHRDIKASNVLVLPDGQPKLLDFGIAKSIADDAGHRVTATSERFFSLATAAPEQLTGAPVTVACDIYSLGVLLYELLAGYAPFADAGDSLPVLIEQIAHRIPPPMRQTAARLDASGLSGRRASASTLARDLSGDIEDIVQRCLRKDPGERYRSVDALDADLQRLREGLPISLRGSQAGYRLRKFVARHRIASALSAALLLSLIASAWIVALQNVRIRAERDQAEEALTILKDAFVSADPYRESSAEFVTAAQILNSALPNVRRNIARNPGLAISLATTMADVLTAMGKSEDAIALLDQVVTNASSTPDSIAELNLSKARAYVELDQLDRADNALDELDRIQPGNLAGMLVRCESALRAEDYASAEDCAKTAQSKAVAANSSDIANEAEWLRMESRFRDGHAADALSSIDAIIARQRQTLPEEHPLLIASSLQRIWILGEMDRAREAIDSARATLALAQKHYGEANSGTGRAYMALGSTLMGVEDYPGAAAAFDSALNSFKATLGTGHPNTLRTLFNRATARQSAEASPAATREAFREAHEAIALHYGPQSNLTVLVATRRAGQLAGTGEPEAALKLMTSDALLTGARSSHRLNEADFRTLLQTLCDRLCRSQSSPDDLRAECRRATDYLNRLS